MRLGVVLIVQGPSGGAVPVSLRQVRGAITLKQELQKEATTREITALKAVELLMLMRPSSIVITTLSPKAQSGSFVRSCRCPMQLEKGRPLSRAKAQVLRDAAANTATLANMRSTSRILVYAVAHSKECSDCKKASMNGNPVLEPIMSPWQ